MVLYRVMAGSIADLYTSMVRSKHSINKAFLVDNLAYRVGIYHPKAEVQIGMGNAEATILVVQPHRKMPERDAVTGALKRFGLLHEAYRATTGVLQFENPSARSPSGDEYHDLIRQNQRRGKPKTDDELNIYYLQELIGIIQPLIVVACGPDVMGMLRQQKVRSFKAYSGKIFRVKDLTKPIFYAILDPVTYGFARAPQDLKRQGENEWKRLAQILDKEKQRHHND